MEITATRSPDQFGLSVNAFISQATMASKAARVEEYIFRIIADRMVEEIWTHKREEFLAAVNTEKINQLVEETLRARLQTAMNFQVKLGI